MFVAAPDHPLGSRLAALIDRIAGMVPSIETLVFLVMLLAFIGFAIQWALLVAGVGIG